MRLSIVRHGRGSAVVARVIEGLPGACARIQVRELQEGSRGTVESRHACCALQRRGCSAWLTCLVEAMGLLCVPELSWVSLERRRGEFEKASGVLGARSIVIHGGRVY